MRIGFKQFIKRKLRKASAYHAVGIAFTADQVLLCALTKKNGKYTWSLDTSFSHNSWQKALPTYVKQEGLAGAPCFFVLSSNWYRIHQVDKPSVDETELFDALQWPIKEISGTDKDIVYDYSDMPAQVAGQNKVMAVAVAREEVAKLSDVIYMADLDLRSIVVEELATVHLVQKSEDAVITLVQEHGEVVVLNIVKDNKLYFTRRIKGFENIGGFSEVELDMGLTESICVQIQRSMDFYESQLRQAPIKRILLKLDSPHVKFLSSSISESMGVICEAFEPNIICADGLDFKMASFSCLGAAYTGALTILSDESNNPIQIVGDDGAEDKAVLDKSPATLGDKAPDLAAPLNTVEDKPEYSAKLEAVDKAPTQKATIETVDKIPEFADLAYTSEKTPEFADLAYTSDKTPEHDASANTADKTPEYDVSAYTADKTPERIAAIKTVEKIPEPVAPVKTLDNSPNLTASEATIDETLQIPVSSNPSEISAQSRVSSNIPNIIRDITASSTAPDLAPKSALSGDSPVKPLEVASNITPDKGQIKSFDKESENTSDIKDTKPDKKPSNSPDRKLKWRLSNENAN